MMMLVLCALSLLIAAFFRPTQTEAATRTVETIHISNKTVSATRPMDLVVLMDASGSIAASDWQKSVKFADAVITLMGTKFAEQNASFRASLGQFSSSSLIDVQMTETKSSALWPDGRYDGLRTFDCTKKGADGVPWDDLCYEDAEYQKCKDDPKCVLRRKGFTEIGAGLCGPRPADGVRTAENCNGGAMGALISGGEPPDNFLGGGPDNFTECEARTTPLKTVLLVTDGQPQAPGCNPPNDRCGRVDTPTGSDDAAVSAKLVKGAWWKAAGTPKLFGIFVGGSGSKGQDQLKAISSCCNFTQVGNNRASPDHDCVCKAPGYAGNPEPCPYYIQISDFDALIAKVGEIVAGLAKFERSVCTVVSQTVVPKVENYTREIPTTELLWLLLLLIPCIMALCWGWILKGLANFISKPEEDTDALELMEAPESMDGPCVGGMGSEAPGTGTSAMLPRKKGAFAGADDPETTLGGVGALPKKKGKFGRGEDEDDDDPEGGGSSQAGKRPKGAFFKPVDAPAGVTMTFKAPGANGIVVNLETPDGTMVPMELPPTSTMEDLKEQVQAATGLEPNAQKLAFDPQGNEPVCDCPLLVGHDIKDGMDLHVMNPLPNGLKGLDPTGKQPGGDGLDSTGKQPGPDGLDSTGKQPGPGGVVVHLVSPEGERVPVTLAPNATFKDLQDKVKGLTGIDPSSQKLAFDKLGKEPVAKAPGLIGYDIKDGTNLFLKPKLKKNPGPCGLDASGKEPGPVGRNKLFKGPGDSGVKTGKVIIELETPDGKTEIEVPDTATWDQVKRKVREATGVDADPDMWAYDPEGNDPITEKLEDPMAASKLMNRRQLLLMTPEAKARAAGLDGYDVTGKRPGVISKTRKGQFPGADGVDAGPMILLKLKTSKGDVPVNLPADATLGDLQEKINNATGIDPGQQQMARDPQGKQPVTHDPSTPLSDIDVVDGTQLHLMNDVLQGLAGADGLEKSKLKMHKLTKKKSGLDKSVASLNASAGTAAAAGATTAAPPMETVFDDSFVVSFHDAPQGTRENRAGTTGAGGFGSFDNTPHHDPDAPASFAFIVEPKDLPPQLRGLAFNPLPVVVVSSALLPAALYLSGAFDGMFALIAGA